MDARQDETLARVTMSVRMVEMSVWRKEMQRDRLPMLFFKNGVFAGCGAVRNLGKYCFEMMGLY